LAEFEAGRLPHRYPSRRRDEQHDWPRPRRPRAVSDEAVALAIAKETIAANWLHI